MKKSVVLIILLPLMAFSLNFQEGLACAFGSYIGAEIGKELAVPTLILASKLGLVDEDEIFSPFSTLIYDSVIIGERLGGSLIPVAVRYILFEEFDPGRFVMDLFLSYALYELTDVLSDNALVSALAEGFYFSVRF